jgi:hypothetical protein
MDAKMMQIDKTLSFFMDIRKKFDFIMPQNSETGAEPV